MNFWMPFLEGWGDSQRTIVSSIVITRWQRCSRRKFEILKRYYLYL